MSSQETPKIIFRDYIPEKDREAAHRIWAEVGWLEKGKEEPMDTTVECGRALVAEVNGEAECLVISSPGTLCYLDQTLPFAGVTGVTTSRIARKRGLAAHLTARLVAADAAEGALVSALGIFDQGYYDKLGFGTGGYELWLSFDPALLKVPSQGRIPRRLTEKDWQVVHASRVARHQGHGAIAFTPAEITKAEMTWGQNAYGLGYFDGPNGELTHHLWCNGSNVEHGPYGIQWLAFQNWDQFLELLTLIKWLGDHVRLVRICEPQGIQLQDFIRQPFKHRQVTKASKFEQGMRAIAYWQMRICDLTGCLARTKLPTGELRFNLQLSDPIVDYLDDDAPWRGVGGEYVVTLGAESGAERGRNQALPTLQASVNAFTRLWLGVRPATGLAVTDDLSGPAELLAELDQILSLPEPKPDWDF